VLDRPWEEMTDEVVAIGGARRRIDPYLGACLLGLAVGEALAVPVVKAIFFIGPLGHLRESAAPVIPMLAPPWSRALWTLLACAALLKGTSLTRGLQAGACAAGLTWSALPFITSGPNEGAIVFPLVLQGLFGALWAAGSWPSACRMDRVGASAVGGLAALVSVGAHALGTRIRLGF
jgi:hypothetical protein